MGQFDGQLKHGGSVGIFVVMFMVMFVIVIVLVLMLMLVCAVVITIGQGAIIFDTCKLWISKTKQASRK